MTQDKDAQELLSTDQLYRIYQRFNDKYFAGKLPKEIKIEWSNKLTTSAGVCYKYKHKCPVIRLSTWYHRKYPSAETEQTLLHEMIHLIAAGHGKEFKKYVESIKEQGGYVELHAKERAKKPRWLYTCKQCGKIFLRDRKLSPRKKYVCGACKGELSELANK